MVTQREWGRRSGDRHGRGGQCGGTGRGGVSLPCILEIEPREVARTLCTDVMRGKRTAPGKLLQPSIANQSAEDFVRHMRTDDGAQARYQKPLGGEGRGLRDGQGGGGEERGGGVAWDTGRAEGRGHTPTQGPRPPPPSSPPGRYFTTHPLPPPLPGGGGVPLPGAKKVGQSPSVWSGPPRTKKIY